jgi:electron transport complex protein RnfD
MDNVGEHHFMSVVKSDRMNSPQIGGAVSRIHMVLLALVPAVSIMTYQFGFGTVINILIAVTTATLSEAIILALRKRPIKIHLNDLSSVLTAVLLGLALPPLAPWWLTVIASLSSIIIAKQLFGNTGVGLFNPAMVGYAVVLLSFPLEMSAWITPVSMLVEGINHPNIFESFSIVFGMNDSVDGITGATPLDAFKQSNGLLVDQIYQTKTVFSEALLAGVGWEIVNIAFLCGGVFLLQARIFSWHAPFAMLTTITILAMIFWDGGSSVSTGSPFMHLLSGGTMMGAFFIITDPSTSVKTNNAKLVYGALIGLFIFVIRAWGDYPDAVAFGALLGNCAAPLIDFISKNTTKISMGTSDAE